MAEDSAAAAGVRIGPQSGPQTQFLSTSADIAIYGGAAGGGKTFAELLEPLRHVGNQDFGAVIFRRTTPQITNDGALWDESLRLYPLLGAKPNQGDLLEASKSSAANSRINSNLMGKSAWAATSQVSYTRRLRDP
jgi:hypothetical protein